MSVIYPLFFLSGFAALTYELLWLRQLGLIFGNTVHAATAVITAYMVGLAIGAHFAGRRRTRFMGPLRVFALLELGIGCYAACIPVLFMGLRVVYRFAYQNVSEALGFLTLLRFVLGVLLLLFPTFLMGATLPILSAGLMHRRDGFGARLGRLYGLNTLGAVAGVLLCGFVMIPYLGLRNTNMVAIAVSLGVALLAWGLSCRMDETLTREPAESGAEPEAGSSRKVVGLLLAAGVCGFLVLGYEMVWFRALILVFGSTTYSFSAMLGIFLLGIAVGATAVSWIVDRVKARAFVLALAVFGIGAYSLASMYWFTRMPELMLRFLAARGTTWQNMIAAKFTIALAFLFVPTVLSGAAFTTVARIIREELSSSRAAGETYAANTAGSALGGIACGFVFLPALGMERSLALLSCSALLLAAVIAVTLATGRRQRFLPVALAALCIGWAIANPPRWDRRLLAAGPYFAPWNFIEDGRVRLRDQLQSDRLLFYEEGMATTVSVVKSADEKVYFCTSGKVEADTTPQSMVLQRMMGHLPMLLHPRPRRALNIGLGAGVTFGALGCYPLDRLEVVEIEPAVQTVARMWGARNHEILENPKAVVTINDGRNHLFCTSRKYDVITSDPFEPTMAGAGHLYTIEHFTQARDRLEAGGVMGQYLPLYELSEDDFMSIARSFVHVFPESLLFFTGYDTILVGFKDGVKVDLGAMREKFSVAAVRASLSDIGFNGSETIMGMLVADMREAGSLSRSGVLNSDDRPVIEFSAPKSALRYTPNVNQQTLLAHYTDMSEGFVLGFSPEERERVTRERDALRKTLEASVLRARGEGQRAFLLLKEAAEQAPENPVIRNELVAAILASAQVMIKARDFEEGYLQYQMVLRYDPNQFWALHHLVTLAMGLRQQPDLAKGFLDRGLAAYPGSPLFIALRGKYRGTNGDVRGACNDLRSALDELPERPSFWRDYAFFLKEAGDAAAAAKAEAMLRALEPRR